MKRNDKIQLIAISMGGLFLLVGVWYWWKYTERTFWGFLGVLIVSSLLGGLIRLIVLTPFIDMDEIRKEEEAERLKREAEEAKRKQEFNSFIQSQRI